MATELGVAYLSLTVSADKVAGGVKKALGEAEGQADATGKSAGSKLGSGLAKGLKIGGTAIAAVTALVAGLALKGGISRALSIEDAQAKLKGLGHDTASVRTIMDSALASVKGTAFGLGDAATVAAATVAAGVKPGQDLTRTLKLVGDASTIAGTSMGDMGAIFNKVASTGKIQGEVIAQLGERGIPILQLLGEELGVSAEEVSKLASQGKVDFATFQNAMEQGMGGAALASGETFRGSLANVGAALGRLGEKIAAPALESLKGIFNAAIPAIDSATESLAPLIDTLVQRAAPAIESIADKVADFIKNFDFDKAIENVQAFSGPLLSLAGALGGALKAALDAVVPILTALAPIVGVVLFAAVSALTTLLDSVLVPALSAVAGWMQENQTAMRVMALVIGTVLLPVLASWSAAQVTAWVAATKKSITSSATQLASHYKVVGGWVASGAAAVRSGAQTVAIWAMYKAQAIAGAAATVAAHLQMAAAWVASKIQAAASAAAAGAAWVAAQAQMAAAWVASKAQAVASAAASGAAWVTSSARAVAAFVAQSAAMVAQKAIVLAGAAATGIATAAQWAWNAAMTANPIGLIIAAIVALIAIVVLLVKNWDTVKEAGARAWQWIKDAWNGATKFFSDLGEKIKNAFKGAFNWVARGWNDTVGKLSWTIPNWVPGLGGRTLSVPKIPMLATGGIVTAPTIAMVGEGREPEAVLPLSKLAAMLDDAGAAASGSRGAPAITITNNYPQAEPTSTTVNRAQDYAAAIGGLG